MKNFCIFISRLFVHENKVIKNLNKFLVKCIENMKYLEPLLVFKRVADNTCLSKHNYDNFSKNV